MIEIKTECPLCHTQQNIQVEDVYGYESWTKGAINIKQIQGLTANQREALLTGICPTCCNAIFKPPNTYNYKKGSKKNIF